MCILTIQPSIVVEVEHLFQHRNEFRRWAQAPSTALLLKLLNSKDNDQLHEVIGIRDKRPNLALVIKQSCHSRTVQKTKAGT